MKTLIVNKKYSNKKLNMFLLDSFPDLSINILNKALRQKDIKINGIRVKENVLLNENDVIDVFIADKFLYKEIVIEKVFEDDNIIIINKPCGVPF